MAGTPSGRGGSKRRSPGHSGRVARVPGKNLCEVATPGRVRLRRRHPAHFGRQIQENGSARTVRQLEVGLLSPSGLVKPDKRDGTASMDVPSMVHFFGG